VTESDSDREWRSESGGDIVTESDSDSETE
jgi:hypothetical protein